MPGYRVPIPEAAAAPSFDETWHLSELDSDTFASSSAHPNSDVFLPDAFSSPTDFTQTSTWDNGASFTNQFEDFQLNTNDHVSTPFDSGIGSAWQLDAFAASKTRANPVPDVEALTPSYSWITDVDDTEAPPNGNAGLFLEGGAHEEFQRAPQVQLDEEVGGGDVEGALDDADGDEEERDDGSEYIASPISQRADSDENDELPDATTYPFDPPLWETFEAETHASSKTCSPTPEPPARWETGGKSVSYTNRLIGRQEGTGSKSTELLLKSSITGILVSTASAEKKLALIASLVGVDVETAMDDESDDSDIDSSNTTVAGGKQHNVPSKPRAARKAPRKPSSASSLSDIEGSSTLSDPSSPANSPTPKPPLSRPRALQMHWTPAENAFVKSILPSIVSEGHTSEARFAIVAERLNVRFGSLYRSKYGEDARRTKSSVKNQVSRVIRGLLPEGVDDRAGRSDGRKRKVVTSARENKRGGKRRCKGEEGQDEGEEDDLG